MSLAQSVASCVVVLHQLSFIINLISILRQHIIFCMWSWKVTQLHSDLLDEETKVDREACTAMGYGI